MLISAGCQLTLISNGVDETLDEKVYEKAVKLLTVRLHTTGEMHRKLRARGFKDEEIRPVLRKLEELNFLDDLRFSQIFIDNLKRYKDFGYYGIKAKLLARQIPSSMAEEALRDFFTPEDELVVARRLLKKLSARGRPASGGKSYEQKARALGSRGFRLDAIRSSLSDA